MKYFYLIAFVVVVIGLICNRLTDNSANAPSYAMVNNVADRTESADLALMSTSALRETIGALKAENAHVQAEKDAAYDSGIIKGLFIGILGSAVFAGLVRWARRNVSRSHVDKVRIGRVHRTDWSRPTRLLALQPTRPSRKRWTGTI